jgi:heme exporter protein CcmD
MMHFLDMGGYGAFVWPAYGITALGLGAAILLTLRSYFRAKTLFADLGDKNK